MGMDVRALATFGNFLRVERRIVNGEHITMPRELLAEKLAHGTFEGSRIRAGAGRDDQVHNVPALSTVQFLAPLLLDEIASLRRIADQPAGLVENLPAD